MAKKEWKDNIWVGLLEVRAKPNSDLLGKNQGAYVTVLACAKNEKSYLNIFKKALNERGLIFLGFEEFKSCHTSLVKYPPNDVFLMRWMSVLSLML